MPHLISDFTLVVRSIDGMSRKEVIEEKNEVIVVCVDETNFVSAPEMADWDAATFEVTADLVASAVDTADLPTEPARLVAATTGEEADSAAKNSVPPLTTEAATEDEVRTIPCHCLTIEAVAPTVATLVEPTVRRRFAAADWAVDFATETVRLAVAAVAEAAVRTSWIEPAEAAVPAIDETALRTAATDRPNNAVAAEAVDAIFWAVVVLKPSADDAADLTTVTDRLTVAAAAVEADTTSCMAPSDWTVALTEDAALRTALTARATDADVVDEVEITWPLDLRTAAELDEVVATILDARTVLVAVTADDAARIACANEVFVAVTADAADTANSAIRVPLSAAAVADEAARTRPANLIDAPTTEPVAECRAETAAVLAEDTALVALRMPNTLEDRATELAMVADSVAKVTAELGIRSSSNHPATTSASSSYHRASYVDIADQNE